MPCAQAVRMQVICMKGKTLAPQHELYARTCARQYLLPFFTAETLIKTSCATEKKEHLNMKQMYGARLVKTLNYAQSETTLVKTKICLKINCKDPFTVIVAVL